MTASTHSEDVDYDDENGDQVVTSRETISCWPAIPKRKRPRWLLDHGMYAFETEDLDRPLLEIYTALDHDLYILAAIGIRTCFDVAAQLLGVKSAQSFRAKLDYLVQKGDVTLADRESLQILVDAGSASAHRGWQPTPADLNILMDVLEQFLEQKFVAPMRQTRRDAQLAALAANIPSRDSAAI